MIDGNNFIINSVEIYIDNFGKIIYYCYFYTLIIIIIFNNFF